MELDKQIEAVLFWKGEPMTLPELCRSLKVSSVDAKKALEELKLKLEGRGITLVQTEDEIALATASATHEVIERLRKEELSTELGKAALETLSIVLYKGKVSRRDIEYIRGVNSTAILRSLLIRGLVERKQSETDERVFLYHPTIELVSLLGLSSVEDLPLLESIRAELEVAKTEQEKQTVSVADMGESILDSSDETNE